MRTPDSWCNGREHDGNRSHYRDLVPESAPNQSGDRGTSPRPCPGRPPNDRSSSCSACAPSGCSTARAGSTRSSSRPAPSRSRCSSRRCRSGLQAGGHVIAIAPEWPGPAGRCGCRWRARCSTRHRIAVHETALPPLAATVLASLASALRRRTRPPPACSPRCCPSSRPSCTSSPGWAASPASSTPAPSFGQHVASLSPGSAFGVSSYPEPSVHRLGGEPRRRPAAADRAAVAAGRRAARRRRRAGCATSSTPRSAGSRCAQIEPTPGGPQWWGTGKLVEAVAYPVDVERLAAELTAALDPWICRWCRELIARSPCPLCGHRGRPPRRGGRARSSARAQATSTAPPATRSDCRRRGRRERRPRSRRGRRSGPAGTATRLGEPDRGGHAIVPPARAVGVADDALHASGALGAAVVPARPLRSSSIRPPLANVSAPGRMPIAPSRSTTPTAPASSCARSARARLRAPAPRAAARAAQAERRPRGVLRGTPSSTVAAGGGAAGCSSSAPQPATSRASASSAVRAAASSGSTSRSARAAWLRRWS